MKKFLSKITAFRVMALHQSQTMMYAGKCKLKAIDLFYSQAML